MMVARRAAAPAAWYGGKQALVPTLLPLLTPHDCYVEPFGGMASLLWAKQPSKVEVYNDKDAGLVNFFRVLREQGEALRSQLALTLYSRQEYLEARSTWESVTDPIEQARRWFVVIAQGFSSAADLHSGWSYSRDASNNPAQGFRNYVQVLPWFINRLAGVQIEHDDAAAVIRRYDNPATLHYCDPPYLPEARKRRGYRHEMTREDHIRLLEVITSCQGKVVLSGYRSALYDEALAGWERIDKATVNYASNKEREARTECIWISPTAAQRSLWAM